MVGIHVMDEMGCDALIESLGRSTFQSGAEPRWDGVLPAACRDSPAWCACMHAKTMPLQMEVSRSEVLETDDTPQWVGADADLIFAPALIFAVSQGVSVTLNQQYCNVTSTPTEVFQAGMNTQVSGACSFPCPHRTWCSSAHSCRAIRKDGRQRKWLV